MTKRNRNIIRRAIMKIATASGAVVRWTSPVTATLTLRWHRDGAHGHAAWGVIGTGGLTVSVEVLGTPWGVCLAGEDRRRCYNRPDHPDGKWEARLSLEDAGLLKKIPWQIAAKESSIGYATYVAVRREEARINDWLDAMVEAGATRFCHGDRDNETVAMNDAGETIATLLHDAKLVSSVVVMAIEMPGWRWSQAREAVKYAS